MTKRAKRLQPNAALVEALRQRNQLGAALRKLCEGFGVIDPDFSSLDSAEKLLAEIWPDEAAAYTVHDTLDAATAHKYKGMRETLAVVCLGESEAHRQAVEALLAGRPLRVNGHDYEVLGQRGDTFMLRLCDDAIR